MFSLSFPNNIVTQFPYVQEKIASTSTRREHYGTVMCCAACPSQLACRRQVSAESAVQVKSRYDNIVPMERRDSVSDCAAIFSLATLSRYLKRKIGGCDFALSFY